MATKRKAAAEAEGPDTQPDDQVASEPPPEPENEPGLCEARINYYRGEGDGEKHIGTGPGCGLNAGHKAGVSHQTDGSSEIHPTKVGRWE
ncbi:hypothetical protein LCGC14_0391490 [marine sediment metagenome]|uniref:Uncharacterized protein n=1 Tax=marine sediment metagenome TaxID=412755 RepID=A0A0F9W8H8_9ZZZZ